MKTTLALLALVPSLASAAPGLPHDLPPRCAPLAQIPRSATIPGPTFAAETSVANCLAELAMSAATVDRLDAAVAPSLHILDDVIQHGDPAARLVAEDAVRDTYQGMIVRARIASVTPPDRWRDREEQATAAMRDLLRTHRDLSRQNAVLANIVRDDGLDLVARASR